MIAAPGWAWLETQKTQSVGMIELPDSAKTETQIGTIVAYPEGTRFVEEGVLVDVPPFKEGDTVAFQKYHSSEVEWAGKKYQAVRLNKIVGKVA